ncbi:MAG: MotA/TolQ/ExbB proton channel family protein [SAR324 cluster bacterium]|nr:MotA/TolQ/ExbB proton channel family protein [SAR324 cluster bacterium]
MKDTIGTLLGFLIGISLVLFGITWPDHLSNYYMYQLREYEMATKQMKKDGVPRNQIQELEQKFSEFQDSWIGTMSRFIDLKSFLIVMGGAYSAMMVAFPFDKAMGAFVFIVRVFASSVKKEEFLDVYHTVLKLAEKRVNNAILTDEDINAIHSVDLKRWVQDFIVVDIVEENMIEEIVRSEIEMYNYRSFEEIDVLNFLGAASPAFGMLGTVVGLILMLGNTGGDVAGVMGGMSIALITTLYGVFLAQIMFLPIASKRYQMKESHIMLLEMIREGLLYLKRREIPDTISQDLIIYLPLKMRQKITEEKMAAMREGNLGL